MTSTGYVTDQFSTLAGLAGVAYGDVEYFREVQNQILSKSPFPTLNISRPSENLEGFSTSRKDLVEVIKQGIQIEYGSNTAVQDYIDINLGPRWTAEFDKVLPRVFAQELDSIEGYGVTFSELFSNAVSRIIPDQAVVSALGNAAKRALDEDLVGADLDLILSIVANSPQSAISSPPPNSIIELDNSIDLGKDFRGVDLASGYLSPKLYQSGIPYPSFSSSFEITGSVLESVRQGRVGYPSSSLQEFTEFDGPSNSTSIQSLNSLVEQTDRDIYEISLIGPRINGFLSYDAKTKSNGDFVDRGLVEESENKDPTGGALAVSRKTKNAF